MQNRKSLEQIVAASGGREASMHAQRMQESAKTEEMLRTQLKRCHELQVLKFFVKYIRDNLQFLTLFI